MKVSELTKDQLNHWTAKAQGWKVRKSNSSSKGFYRYYKKGAGELPSVDMYRPSTDKAQAMDLVMMNEMKTGRMQGSSPLFLMHWAQVYNSLTMTGDTPMIAICRAKIVSVYGEEVPDA